MRSILRAAGAAAALFVVVLATALPAWAHATLVRSVPADDSIVDGPVQEVELEFNEPVGLEADGVIVLNGAGERVEAGPAEQDTTGKSLTIPLQPDLPNGSYVVSYRVTSADSHVVRGALVFSIGEEGEIAAVPAGGEGGAETWIIRLNRFLMGAATLMAAGGLLFLGLVHDGRNDELGRFARLVVNVAGVGLLATLIGLYLQALALSTSLGAAFGALPGVATSPYGVASFLRLAALVAVAWVAHLARRRSSGDHLKPAVVALAAVAAVAPFSLTGHTLLSEPRWLATVANIGHTFTAAAWLGGLVLLGLALRRRSRAVDAVGAGTLVARFSRLAFGTVVLLVAAGAILAWIEVRSGVALVTTTYGRTLLVKLGLVALVLLAAAYNQRRLVPSLRRAGDSTAALARLRSTVRFEVVGLVLVIAVTAVLVDFTPAARALSEPVTQLVELDEDTAIELTVENPKVGQATLHIYLLDGLGRPREAQEATLRLSSEDSRIEPITRMTAPAGPGHWIYDAKAMAVPGVWQIEVLLRISDFEQRSATFEVRIT